MSTGKIVIGAVIAMATGAVLGILFAPDKGSTTRKKLSKQGFQSLDALEDTSGDYADIFDEGFDSVMENAVGVTGDAYPPGVNTPNQRPPLFA